MGQTIQDFTRIYDTYIAGVKSGEFRKISTLLSQELRSGIKNKEDQQEFKKAMGSGLILDIYFQILSLTPLPYYLLLDPAPPGMCVSAGTNIKGSSKWQNSNFKYGIKYIRRGQTASKESYESRDTYSSTGIARSIKNRRHGCFIRELQ